MLSQETGVTLQYPKRLLPSRFLILTRIKSCFLRSAHSARIRTAGVITLPHRELVEHCFYTHHDSGSQIMFMFPRGIIRKKTNSAMI